jgi:transketolase
MYDFQESPKLDQRSLYIRGLIIRAFKGGGRGHLGSSMSLVEVLRVLYDDILSYKPEDPLWSDRDRFILSKGHGCLTQYALLADKGFIPLSALDKFCHADGLLGGHPEYRKIPGIEASTGSLGHGPSIGVGLALSAKLKKQSHRIYVVTGDGEINEGSVWEAAMSASKHKLDNFVLMVDYNKLQSYGKVSEVLDLEPLKDKFISFGFEAIETDGHNVEKIREVLNAPFSEKLKPKAIIFHTVKGKGFPFAEHNPSWHHKSKITEVEMLAIEECINLGVTDEKS